MVVFTFPTDVAAPKVVFLSVGARRPSSVPASKTQPTFANPQELRIEVDRILDKLNNDGIDSLSDAERLTLDYAKQLRKK